MPRYCTEGGPSRRAPALIMRLTWCLGVTSAHQYHGETPIVCDNSKTPKAVPRRSLPAITNPIATFGSGLETVAIRKLSHLPRKLVTSSFLARTSASITELLPSVPTITACAERPAASRRNDDFFPVTRSTSSASAAAAICTTLKSSGATRMSAARPPCTSWKSPLRYTLLTHEESEAPQFVEQTNDANSKVARVRASKIRFPLIRISSFTA